MRDPGASEAGRPAAGFCDASRSTEHFKIHFATGGQHRLPGYPDVARADALGAYLEHAYAFYREVLGLDPPVPDDDGLLDVYVYDLDDGYFGHARIEQPAEEGCPGAHGGYIEIATDFGDRDHDEQLKLTSAHELFHLFQYALGAYESSWLKESTARFAEMQVWPEIATPAGVNSWFDTPQLPLYYPGGARRYAPHFWLFLGRVHGEDVMTEVWRRCCDTHWSAALRQELESRGTDLDAALVQFALWNNVTGSADDGHHYQDGHQLPEVRLHGEHLVPIAGATLAADEFAREAASNYIRFRGPAERKTLRISFEGAPELATFRRVSFMATRGTSHTEWILAPDPNGVVTIHIPNWSDIDHVTMIVTNFALPADLRDLTAFRYSAEEVDDSLLEGDQVSDLRVLSNAPSPATSFSEVHFRTAIEGVARLTVHDMLGRRVRELVNRPLAGGEHRCVWDLCDDRGRSVASGIYIVNLESGRRLRTSKIVVVR